jgi:hypothetical protein
MKQELLVIRGQIDSPAFWLHLENLRDEFRKLRTIPEAFEEVYKLMDHLVENEAPIVAPLDVVTRFLGAFKYTEGYTPGVLHIELYREQIRGPIRFLS